MNWLGYIADVIGIFGAIFALLGWLKAKELKKELEHEKIRQHKDIQVVLAHGAEKIELSVKLRRAELTRAEIQGRMGMIPMKKKGKRYSIAYLNTPDYLKQINQIIEGTDEGILTIACTEDEFKQFDRSVRPI